DAHLRCARRDHEIGPTCVASERTEGSVADQERVRRNRRHGRPDLFAVHLGPGGGGRRGDAEHARRRDDRAGGDSGSGRGEPDRLLLHRASSGSASLSPVPSLAEGAAFASSGGGGSATSGVSACSGSTSSGGGGSATSGV